eukprot:scaffold4589_cov132-Cylindrotheca_fusiformis.AAC.1
MKSQSTTKEAYHNYLRYIGTSSGNASRMQSWNKRTADTSSARTVYWVRVILGNKESCYVEGRNEPKRWGWKTAGIPQSAYQEFNQQPHTYMVYGKKSTGCRVRPHRTQTTSSLFYHGAVQCKHDWIHGSRTEDDGLRCCHEVGISDEDHHTQSLLRTSHISVQRR